MFEDLTDETLDFSVRLYKLGFGAGDISQYVKKKFGVRIKCSRIEYKIRKLGYVRTRVEQLSTMRRNFGKIHTKFKLTLKEIEAHA